MNAVKWVLIDNTQGATTKDGSKLSPRVLGHIAEAVMQQVNKEFAAEWGAHAAIRVGTGVDDVAADEIGYVFLAKLPGRDSGDDAYHDIRKKGVPYAVCAVTTCEDLYGPDGVSVDASHEILETHGDLGANLFAYDNDGLLHALEVCDAVEIQTYGKTCVDGTVVQVSNWLLRNWFIPGAAGPYEYMTLAGLPHAVAPAKALQTAPGDKGNYQLIGQWSGNDRDVYARVDPIRGTRRKGTPHWTSRTYLRLQRMGYESQPGHFFDRPDVVFSAPRLHPVVLELDEHRQAAGTRLKAITQASFQNAALRLPAAREGAAPVAAMAQAPQAVAAIAIELSTVSLAGTFDAYITIQFAGSSQQESLLVDSGNTMLIIPYWEHIQGNPAYQVLGEGKEPWSSPAKIVKGPIQIPAIDGSLHTIPDCVFYACTGKPRTANFGTGCISPWTASGWNTPLPGVVMQAPLSCDMAYPFADFAYAAAAAIFAKDASLTVTGGSSLMLYPALPPGYLMLDIKPDVEWMSVVPGPLKIGNTPTQWPGDVAAPIAMVDTGGGPVLLSDPNGYVHDQPWPAPTACPKWACGSDHCICVKDALGITLKDGARSYSYTIDTASLAASVQGLTAVMCKVNEFMWNNQGMNIGGISALFNHILIDYRGARVGFKPRE